MRSAKPYLAQIRHRRDAQLTFEAVLKRAHADVAAGRDSADGERQVGFSLDDVNCGADCRNSEPIRLDRDFGAARMICGVEQPTYQAVDEWLADDRIVQHTVGPEHLLAQREHHLNPTPGRTRCDRHGAIELDGSHYLVT